MLYLSHRQYSIQQHLYGLEITNREEWEYIAEGGDDYIYAGSNNVHEVAYYANCLQLKNGKLIEHPDRTDCVNDRSMTWGLTGPVGQKKPNGYGIYDMSGNVTEMCWDKYVPKQYAKYSAEGITDNPIQAYIYPNDQYFSPVMRGGTAIDHPRYPKFAARRSCS